MDDFYEQEERLKEAFLRQAQATYKAKRLQEREQRLRQYQQPAQFDPNMNPLAALGTAIGQGIGHHRANKRLGEMAPDLAQAQQQAAMGEFEGGQPERFAKYKALQQADAENARAERRLEHDIMDSDRKHALAKARLSQKGGLNFAKGGDYYRTKDGEEIFAVPDPRTGDLVDQTGKVHSRLEVAEYGTGTPTAGESESVDRLMTSVEELTQLQKDIGDDMEAVSRPVHNLPDFANDLLKKGQRAGWTGWATPKYYEERLEKSAEMDARYMRAFKLPRQLEHFGTQYSQGEQALQKLEDQFLNSTSPETRTRALNDAIEYQKNFLNYAIEELKTTSKRETHKALTAKQAQHEAKLRGSEEYTTGGGFGNDKDKDEPPLGEQDSRDRLAKKYPGSAAKIARMPDEAIREAVAEEGW